MEGERKFSTASVERLLQHSLFRFQIQDAQVCANVAELKEMLTVGRDEQDHFEILTEVVHEIEDRIQDSDTRELYLLASLQHFTHEMEMLLEMDNEAELNPEVMPSFAAIFARESDRQQSGSSKGNKSQRAPRTQVSTSTSSAKNAVPKTAVVAAAPTSNKNAKPTVSGPHFVTKREPAVVHPAPAVVAAANARQTATAPLAQHQQQPKAPLVQTPSLHQHQLQKAQQLKNDAPDAGAATAKPAAEEDVTCSVCFEGDSLEGDAIVICELCNTAVHQTCYRIAYLPEGDWYCHPCSRYLKEQDIEKNVTPTHELECAACLTKGGAMVPTVEGEWMHMSCSMFLPELYVQRLGTQGEVICGVCALRNGLKFAFIEAQQQFGSGCLTHQEKFLSMEGLNVEDGDEAESFPQVAAAQDTIPVKTASPTTTTDLQTPSSKQEKKKAKSDKKGKDKRKSRASSWEEGGDDDDEYIRIASDDDDEFFQSGDDEVQVVQIKKSDQKLKNKKRQMKPESSGSKNEDGSAKVTKKSRQSTLPFAFPRPTPATPIAPHPQAPSFVLPSGPATNATNRLVLHSRVFVPAYYPPGLRNNDGDKDYEYVMILIQSMPIGMVIATQPTSYGTGIFLNGSKTHNPVVSEALARGVLHDGDEVFAMNHTILRNVSIEEVHNIIPTLKYPVQCWFRTKRRNAPSPTPPAMPAFNNQQSDLKRDAILDEKKQDGQHSGLNSIKEQAETTLLTSGMPKPNSLPIALPEEKSPVENEGLSVDWPWFYLRSDGKVAMNLFWRSFDGAFFLRKMNTRVMLALQDKIETMVGVRFSSDHPGYNQVQELLVMPKREQLPQYLVDFRKSRKQKQRFLSSDIFMGVSAETLKAEDEVDEQTSIAIGTIVTVAKRTWAGINKLGGAGRVRKVHEESLDGGKKRFTYDIAYVLGGGEKKVERKYISVVDLNKEAEKEKEESEVDDSGIKTDEEGEGATPMKMRLRLQVDKSNDETLLLALSALAVNNPPEAAPRKRVFQFQVSTANGNVHLEHKTRDENPTAKDLLLHKHFEVKMSDEDAIVKACFHPTLLSAEERSIDDVDDLDDEGASDHDEEDEIKAQLESLQRELSTVLTRSQDVFASIKSDIEREYATKAYRKRILEEIQWKHYEQMYRETVAARDQFDDSDDESEKSDEETSRGRRPGSQKDRSRDAVSSDDEDEESEDDTFGGLFVNKIKQEGDEICVLCELSGGDFAATSCGRVVHPQCAMYTPETYFKDGVAHGMDQIPVERRALSCAICHGRKGLSKIQCANKRCVLAYHISCAYINGLLIRDPHYQAWCPKHLKSSGMAQEVELPKHLLKASAQGGRGASKAKKRATHGKKGRRETPRAEATAPGAISSSKTNRKRKRKSSIRNDALENPDDEKLDDTERSCVRRLDIDEDSDGEQDSAEGKGSEDLQQAPQQVFRVDDVVLVLAREWVGSNKPGGVARIRAVHKAESNDNDKLLYDVAYVLGSTKEKRVEAEYVRAYQKAEQSNDGPIASNRKKTRNA